MDLDFEVVLREVDESYPDGLIPAEIAVFIAEKKAEVFTNDYRDCIVITADTIVAHQGEILGKPNNAAHAMEMLTKLSGSRHEVFTGVSITYDGKTMSFYDSTEVYFKTLTEEQILYYINCYNPYDKAGAYGVQDWIGLVAVEKIVGSYTNVMGLPTEKLYNALAAI